MFYEIIGYRLTLICYQEGTGGTGREARGELETFEWIVRGSALHSPNSPLDFAEFIPKNLYPKIHKCSEIGIGKFIEFPPSPAILVRITYSPSFLPIPGHLQKLPKIFRFLEFLKQVLFVLPYQCDGVSWVGQFQSVSMVYYHFATSVLI